MNAVTTFPEVPLAMAPPREERRVNADQLSFPLPMVLAMLTAIALTAFAVGGMQYVFTTNDREARFQMQSDIRSIVQRLDAQAQIDAANKRADAAESDANKQSYESTKAAVDSMRGVVQLLQLQVAELLKRK